MTLLSIALAMAGFCAAAGPQAPAFSRLLTLAKERPAFGDALRAQADALPQRLARPNMGLDELRAAEARAAADPKAVLDAEAMRVVLGLYAEGATLNENLGEIEALLGKERTDKILFSMDAYNEHSDKRGRRSAAYEALAMLWEATGIDDEDMVDGIISRVTNGTRSKRKAKPSGLTRIARGDGAVELRRSHPAVANELPSPLKASVLGDTGAMDPYDRLQISARPTRFGLH